MKLENKKQEQAAHMITEFTLTKPGRAGLRAHGPFQIQSVTVLLGNFFRVRFLTAGQNELSSLKPMSASEGLIWLGACRCYKHRRVPIA
jgi:hypothetical protein